MAALQFAWTESGPVAGRRSALRLDHDGVVRGTAEAGVFLGIPYAAPPIGELRWAPPAPPETWREPLRCDGHAAAMQTDFYDDWSFDASAAGVSEDCLVLDVHTPASAPGERLPVMLWIHGGAYQAGGSLLAKYHPAVLVERGIVVVSVEYRVGVFGFLAHPWLSAADERSVSGNYGMLDVFAAARWVRRNIAQFGGDPENVTVFGQSAGGNISGSFLYAPDAEGGADRVIIQSGTGDPELPVPLATAESWGAQLTADLGVSSLAEFRALPARFVLDGAMEMHRRHGRMWAPNIDGVVFPDPVLRLFREGRFRPLPTLISSTSEDAPLGPAGALDSDAALADEIRTRFGDAAAEVIAALPEARPDTPDARRAMLWHLVNRHQVDARARFIADALTAAGAPAWIAGWSRVPPGWERLGDGAFHEIELAYLFDAPWLGYPRPRWEGVDGRLAEAIQSSWTGFARGGDPSPAPGIPWRPFLFGEPETLAFGGDGARPARVDPELDRVFLRMWNAGESS
ncbi:carboxylesterase/lipase family protein [Leucobacter sp. wl10]|uniref:carboxylesterase/lipase family protein n=1 Tax=Leucobacter sp. wl10 TaxID=2304677 RepID=UPI000E5C344D|nr:carboxylesterase family protein [Leucobacter sp. wl10]RGE20388.1 hypothetical protein D1J51_09420 [Leucobacter sp. wl10]